MKLHLLLSYFFSATEPEHARLEAELQQLYAEGKHAEIASPW
jgi:hypothetical protein